MDCLNGDCMLQIERLEEEVQQVGWLRSRLTRSTSQNDTSPDTIQSPDGIQLSPLGRYQVCATVSITVET